MARQGFVTGAHLHCNYNSEGNIRMSTYADIASAWVDHVLGKRPAPMNGSRSRIIVYGVGPDAKIYSYGRHFELARLLRASGKPVAFLLNGDRHSNSTTSHQEYVRAAAGKSGLPVLVVPFTAIFAARIDPDTIRPLEVTPDRGEYTWHAATVPVAGPDGWVQVPFDPSMVESWHAKPWDDTKTVDWRGQPCDRHGTAGVRYTGPDGYAASRCTFGYDHDAKAYVEHAEPPPRDIPDRKSVV